MQELLQFVWAVISHWQAYLTGGVIVALLFVFERLSGRTISARFVLWGIGVFLLVAFFMAWRDQYRALLSTQKELANERDKGRPKFSGVIDYLVVGNSPELEGAQAFLLLTIRNLGAPSAADRWRISVEGPGFTMADNPYFIPDGYKLIGEGGKLIAEFRRSDAIYEKAISPIMQGAIVRGWLRCVLKGLTSQQLHHPGVRWRVEFVDILDQHCQITYITAADTPSSGSYFPGAEQPFRIHGDEVTSQGP